MKEPIIVFGSGKLAFSLTACLLQAGHPVTLCTESEPKASSHVKRHLDDLERQVDNIFRPDLSVTTDLKERADYHMAFIISGEDMLQKKSAIKKLEASLPARTPIMVNTESFPLSDIQDGAIHPERIIGANWVEPAHTTYFLEIISNEKNDRQLVDDFYTTAKHYWNKDPYILANDTGIRARLMGAMAREAFYLVENGYVAVEDIDRACRNDAGYYLPFSGNFRYMDLMGTYIYGVVMKDLNPELSKDRHIPAFFLDIIRQGGKGMENSKGLYTYEDGEVEKYYDLFRKFTYQIRQIISKYSFDHKDETTLSERKKAVGS